MIYYVVVNNCKREKFEKKYQLTYGYSESHIFTEEGEAIEYVETMGTTERNQTVVERCENGICEEIYNGMWYDIVFDLEEE